MNNEKTTITDAPSASSKPKKQRSNGRLTKEIYLIDEQNDFNEPEFLGALPERTDERRHIRKNYGAGLYLIEEKQSGRFKGRYEIRIEDEPEAEPLPKVKFESDDESDFDDDEPQQTNGDPAADVRVFLMQQENERLKNELRRQQTVSQSSQSEMMQMMLMMQEREDKAFQRGLAMLELMKQQPAQQQQPAKDPLQMLSEIIAVNRGVRELSDELTPPPARESSGSLLGDAAQLIDSLKGIAPALLPMLLSGQTAQPTAQRANSQPMPNAPTGDQPSLSELFAQGAANNGENEE